MNRNETPKECSLRDWEGHSVHQALRIVKYNAASCREAERNVVLSVLRSRCCRSKPGKSRDPCASFKALRHKVPDSRTLICHPTPNKRDDKAAHEKVAIEFIYYSIRISHCQSIYYFPWLQNPIHLTESIQGEGNSSHFTT